MQKIIMHLDMDAFFAAVEQRDNPALRGKPVIVGAIPGGRGVVSTASYEARKYGIRSAMPISESYRRCPHGVYLRPDFKRYQEASDGLEEILGDVSPIVEMASIDEAYIEISGSLKLHGSPLQIATKIKEKIRRNLRLSASVGIGPNRLIAKIASDMHKPDGLTIVEPDGVKAFLAPLSVAKIPGVGKKAEEALNRIGLFTIGQLASRSESELVRRFGASMGNFLYERSHGIASDSVGGEEERKSISKERTFGKDTKDAEFLHRILLNLSCDVGRTARKERLFGRTITLKIRLTGFETHTRSRTYEDATAEDDIIFQCVWEQYRTSAYVEKPVRLIGVGLSDLSDGSGIQLSLLDRGRKEKSKKVYEAIDKISERFGKKAIRPARAFEPLKAKKKPGKD